MNRTPDLTLVLTHGRDQPFEVPATEARAWADAVRWGLERANAPYYNDIAVDFAFYGDLWRADHIVLQATDGSDELFAIQAGIAAELLAALGGDPVVPQTDSGWSALTFLLREIEDRLPFVGEKVLRLFLQDLGQYFTQPGLREGTMQRVAAHIQAAPGKVVLLAHSMGTVVSYDLLARQPHLPVQAYISFGSVLGFQTVQNYVRDARGNTPFPAGLKQWINVYNSKDFATVAWDLTPIYMSNDGRRVENRRAEGRTPSPFNPMAAHDPIVYLSSHTMGQALRSILEDADH